MNRARFLLRHFGLRRAALEALALVAGLVVILGAYIASPEPRGASSPALTTDRAGMGEDHG